MKKKPKPRAPHIAKPVPILTCVALSDTHCGCRMAIMGDTPIILDDGGEYCPSPYQAILAEKWRIFWEDWVPQWTKGEPFIVVCNGDIIDGVHHNSTSQISQNISDQANIAIRLWEPIVSKCEGRFYLIRGTEAHVGKSAAEEERIGRALRAVPNADGQFSRWDLWLRLGDGLIHFLHHIGTTGSAAYETTAICRELVAEFNESARWGDSPPDVIVRSHAHRDVKIEIPTRRGRGIGLITPAWQLKTSFAWKSAGSRLAPPQIGGTIIRRGDRGLFVTSQTWTLSRSPLVTI